MHPPPGPALPAAMSANPGAVLAGGGALCRLAHKALTKKSFPLARRVPTVRGLFFRKTARGQAVGGLASHKAHHVRQNRIRFATHPPAGGAVSRSALALAARGTVGRPVQAAAAAKRLVCAALRAHAARGGALWRNQQRADAGAGAGGARVRSAGAGPVCRGAGPARRLAGPPATSPRAPTCNTTGFRWPGAPM